jgi:hypothetical protein
MARKGMTIGDVCKKLQSVTKLLSQVRDAGVTPVLETLPNGEKVYFKFKKSNAEAPDGQ